MSKFGLTNTIERNFIFHLTSKLLDAGLFDTVNVSELNFGSGDLSLLIPVNDEGIKLTTGTTEFWQSPIRNWVYESGVTVPSGFATPIVASGITVNSVFKERSDVTFGHIIDYDNGRIIFDTAQAIAGNTMQAEFSFKIVRIKTPEPRDEIFLGRTFTLNPEIEKTTETMPGLAQELPLILVEWVSQSFAGLQLGGGRIVSSRILLHVLAEENDSYKKNEIVDVLAELDGSVMTMVDWNKALDPIDFNGDFAPGAEPFSFKILQADNSVFFHKLYIDSIEPINISSNLKLSQAMLDLNTTVNIRAF